jgi:hypothetical protein
MRFSMPSFTASVICFGAAMACLTPAQAAPPSTSASQGTNSVAKGGPESAADAPAKPDDPAKVAAAREFIILYHPQMNPLNISAKIDRFIPRMVQAAKEQDPKLDVKKFVRERRAQLLKQSQETIDRQAHVVSRHFSMDELRQLTAFFRSPLGRKLNDESPKIQKDLSELRRPPMQKITVKPSDGDGGDDHKDSKNTTLYKTGSEPHGK